MVLFLHMTSSINFFIAKCYTIYELYRNVNTDFFPCGGANEKVMGLFSYSGSRKDGNSKVFCLLDCKILTF